MKEKITELAYSIFDCNRFLDSFEFWQHSDEADFYTIALWTLIPFMVLLAFVLFFNSKKSAKVMKTVSKNLLPISAGIWIAGFIIYLTGMYSAELGFLSIAPRAIISAFKMFAVSNDIGRVQDIFQKDIIYMTAFSLVHFAAALTTSLFIFKMIGYKLSSALKIAIHKLFKSKNRAVHLFWGVNEASCLMAEDIRRHHPDDTIIFVGMEKESDSDSQKKTSLSNMTRAIKIKSSEIVRLDNIDALVDNCLNGPAGLNEQEQKDVFTSLRLRNIGEIIEKSKKVCFYFLSDDEALNIAGALNMLHDKRLCHRDSNENIVYVHARRDANNEVFDHYAQYGNGNRGVRIKIIDSAYLSVTTLKQRESALPVNCVEIDKATGTVTSPFTAMIIGFGNTGLEAFKFLYEFSAFIGPDMNKSPFKCYAIDEKMNSIAGLVRQKMPAIGEDELELIQAPVDSEVFWDKVKATINGLNYIVIALNNDDTGLALAVNMFKYALNSRGTCQAPLKIMVRCYNAGNAKRMREAAESLNSSTAGYNIEICLFGEEKDLYCCDTILSDNILTAAQEFNKVYEKSDIDPDKLWQKCFGETEITRLITKKNMSRYHAIRDINRRIAQNISNTLHRSTKMILMGLGNGCSKERLDAYIEYAESRKAETTTYECDSNDARLLVIIAMVEHERWIASHKLMGYVYGKENDIVKKHNVYICPWEELSENIQSYDCNVVDTTLKLARTK